MKKSIQYCLLVLMIIILAACPMGDPDPDPGPGPDPDTDGKISWFKAPDGKSTYDVTALAENARSMFARLAAPGWTVDSNNNSITPDSLSIAYRYIALVTEDVVLDIDATGLMGTKGSDDGQMAQWSETNLEDYKNGPGYTKIPGYDSSFIRMEDGKKSIGFEAFIDDHTPIDKEDIAVDAFVLFDGTNGTPADTSDDSVVVFDLADSSFILETGDLPPADVGYCGVASELVYYEAEIVGYGLIRLYYNDFGDFKAGDMAVKLDGESDWKWVYLQHGDGPDAPFTAVSYGAYSDVWAPNDPDNPTTSDWSDHPYTGTYDLNETTTLPTFMYTYGDNGGSWASGPANSDKRPSAGTGAGAYWVATDQVMNAHSETNQNLSPHIDDDENPGGFGTYDPGNPIDSTPITTTVPEGRALTQAVIHGGEEDNAVYVVYYETDDHLGTSDFSRLDYQTSRRADGVISRDDMQKRFGVYAYDSGLISNVYDDSSIITSGFDVENNPIEMYPTLLELAMGRILVQGYRSIHQDGTYSTYTYTAPQPGPDILDNTTVRVDVSLEMIVDMRYGEDCMSRAWDTTGGGTTVGSDNFPGRFMTFTPNYMNNTDNYFYWGSDPDEPVPLQRGFYGAGSNDHQLETDLSFQMGRFYLEAHNVGYYEVYARPPELSPKPEDGPFDPAQSLNISISPDGSGNVTCYYTTDGSDPDDTSQMYVDGGNNPGISSMTSDTRVKVIAYDDTKEEPSAILDVWYKFSQPTGTNFRIQCTGLEQPDGTTVMAGLFGSQALDINQNVQALYGGMETLTGGSAVIQLSNVPDGTYYLGILLDLDGDQALSTGDKFFPQQSSGTEVLNLESTDIPTVIQHDVTTDTPWYEIP